MNKFIHQSTIVYLAVIILLRMMAMPLSLLDFSLNQRFIAENLCENRQNTTMHCAGKCYLSKKLAKTSENPESQNQKGVVKILIIDFFENMDKPAFVSIHAKQVYTGSYQLSLSNRYTGNIFHPPIA